MIKFIFFVGFTFLGSFAQAQSSKVELYDLIKMLSYDSTGYENVGDWAIGNTKNFPVTWKTDRVEMSDDTSINFFRTGNTQITFTGKTFTQNGLPVKWTIMLKGPRMGYTSYSIISSPSSGIAPNFTIDTLFPKRSYRYQLLKTCSVNPISGFNYYEVKLPKKDPIFMKVGWLTMNGSTALRIDVFDGWSKHAAKLNCPK